MCTLSGEQIARKGFVNEMYAAGMRAVRINTAHLKGTKELEELGASIKAVNRDIKVLIDTKGPEMRTTATSADTEIMLSEGDRLIIEGSNNDEITTGQHIVVNYPNLCLHVETGDRLMIDDGRIELIVENVTGNVITACVVRGGNLGSRKGVSIVGKEPDLPAVGMHDLDFIRVAAKSADIDVIAHSFVRSAADIVAVKKVLNGSHKPVVAKIENQQGLDNLEEITEVADGILIARGDLTATLGEDAVPAAQAKIASATTSKGLPLYLATKILPSMMDNTVATEDDIAGITTALKQGVDTMLLTNETATGHYPVACVSTLFQVLCQ